MHMPELLERTVYTPGHEPMTTRDYRPTDEDIERMSRANELGARAARLGTTPVGAVLIHPASGGYWEAMNREFTDGDVTAHPEFGVYSQFRNDLPELGLDMSGCALYSNVEACVGCSYFFVKKPKLGALYLGVLYEEVEFFRTRKDTPGKTHMNDILRFSRHPHMVVTGLLRDEAKKLFVPENNVHHRLT